ncbi:MAG: glycosyltransferase family 39 protein [Planctomycetota bacterium]
MVGCLLRHLAAAPVGAFALICLMLLPRLGEAPLGKTEGHRALTGHEMVATGEWVTPRLFGQLYLRKPPGQYWLVAASESVFGANEFAWRLPSALATAGLAGFLAWTGRRWFGSAAGGWAAGLSVACLVPLWDQGLTADLDAAHNLAVAVAAVAMIELVAEPRRRKARWAWVVGGGLAMGAVLLTKVHAGLPLVAGAMIGSAVATSRWRGLAQPHVYAAIGVALVLPAAWAGLLLWEHGGLPADMRGVSEAAAPFDAAGAAAAVGGGLLAALLCFAYGLPTTAALPLTMRRAKGRWRGLPGVAALSEVMPRKRAMLRAAALAVYVAWLIYALAGITNPRYLYPTLTLAPLAVAGLADAWRRGDVPAGAQAVIRAAGTAIAVIGGAGLAVVGVLLAVRNAEFAPALAAVLVLLALGLGAAAVRAWWRHRAGAGAALTALVIGCASVPMVQVHGDERRGAWSYASARVIGAEVERGEAIYAHDVIWDVPHLLWYADRPIVGVDAALDRPQRLPDGAAWLVLSADELAGFKKRGTAGLGEAIELRPSEAGGGVGPVLLRYDPTR